jgi:hypothetical protein
MNIENKGNILQIEDARIVYRNFSGIAGKYNREGDRNFAVVIPEQEIADDLIKDGWNVKIRPPRDEDDTPFMYLPVKIKFNDRGPGIYINTFDGGLERLNEDTVGSLDNIDIRSVSLDVRAYDWEVNGKTGRTAYLQGMEVTQNIDRFAAKYAESQRPNDEQNDLPF